MECIKFYKFKNIIEMITYKGKKIADKGLVINLPHRTDRKESSNELLKSLGFEGYEYIDGVIKEDPWWRRYGAVQAFLNCAKVVLDENLDSLIIFEDDIKVMNHVTEEDFKKVFDKWDNFTEYYDIIALGTRPLPDAKIVKDDENFGTLSNCVCAQAFYFKRPFLEYFYENLKNYEDPNDPYYKVIHDEFINDCCSHEIIYKKRNKLFKVGITIPMLFSQHGGWSDNEWGEYNHDGWIEHCYWQAVEKGKL